MSGQILVAGVGNIFLRDDAFGVEVLRHLATRELPDGVTAQDYGIRGVHLAYDLMNGYETLILIDAVPRDEPPGTLFVIEPETEDFIAARSDAVEAGTTPLVDGHGMEPGSMLATLDMLGGNVERVLVVGCQPADVSEGMGLSPEVGAAIPAAVEMTLELIDEELGALQR